jgi:hypothetical protein
VIAAAAALAPHRRTPAAARSPETQVRDHGAASAVEVKLAETNRSRALDERLAVIGSERRGNGSNGRDVAAGE